MPAALSALAIWTASSAVSPPSTQSVPVMRAPSGMARSAFERAAKLIVALIRQRRDETVQQITMREVQLDRIEAEPYRTLGRVGKIGTHPRHVFFVHCARGVPARPERQ